jgi:hypothetical protein
MISKAIKAIRKVIKKIIIIKEIRPREAEIVDLRGARPCNPPGFVAELRPLKRLAADHARVLESRC